MTLKLSLLIPTLDNNPVLHACINSCLEHTAFQPSKPWFEIVIINNGDKENSDRIQQMVEQHPMLRMVDAGENLGWEGGLKLGLEATTTPYLCFLNDDTHIVPGNTKWLTMMTKVLDRDPSVAAVGPISNFVAGLQNLQRANAPRLFDVSMLIGFCMLVRRSALDAIGGVPLGLPGGDDIDISIKFLAAGFKLVMHAGVFVFHHGCLTGGRVRDDWNSAKMIEDTRNELIRRNGLENYYASIKMVCKPYALRDV